MLTAKIEKVVQDLRWLLIYEAQRSTSVPEYFRLNFRGKAFLATCTSFKFTWDFELKTIPIPNNTYIDAANNSIHILYDEGLGFG